MKIAVFSTHVFDKSFLEDANKYYQHELVFFETTLTEKTVSLAAGFPAIACFVTDQLKAPVLKKLAKNGTRLIALRSAGFNHVDIVTAKALGLAVVRVPAYSPHAVAEFAVGLILALNRKIHRAYNRTREHNFSLEGLLGFDLCNRTIGVVGTGNIGAVFTKIMQGFGCKILACDPFPNPDLKVPYVTFDSLCEQADIISLHCPLTAETRHIINAQALAKMKSNVMLINTGRGALIDTSAVICALKKQKIGYLGIDVYEEEENLFFQDLSEAIIQDDIFTRLQTFPNVIITGHQAFFTEEAIINISKTTLANIYYFEHAPDKLKDTLLT
jgi:D-lactate dehydrogenase